MKELNSPNFVRVREVVVEDARDRGQNKNITGQRLRRVLTKQFISVMEDLGFPHKERRPQWCASGRRVRLHSFNRAGEFILSSAQPTTSSAGARWWLGFNADVARHERKNSKLHHALLLFEPNGVRLESAFIVPPGQLSRLWERCSLGLRPGSTTGTLSGFVIRRGNEQHYIFRGTREKGEISLDQYRVDSLADYFAPKAKR